MNSDPRKSFPYLQASRSSPREENAVSARCAPRFAQSSTGLHSDNTKVLILSDAPPVFSEELGFELTAHGWYVLKTAGITQSVASSDYADLDPDVVILLFTSAAALFTADRHHSVGSLSALHGCEWIVSVVHQSQLLLVGPLLSVETKPCHFCVCDQMRSVLESQPHGAGVPEPLHRLQATFAAGIISETIAIHKRSRHDTLRSARDMSLVMYDLKDLSSIGTLVGRTPECPTCWPKKMPKDGLERIRIWPTALFEECARHSWASERKTLAASHADYTKISQAAHTRKFPNSPLLQLPSWSDLYTERVNAPTEEFGLRKLAELLFLSFGRWNAGGDSPADRVLPSAGNLGSPEAFLLNRNVTGLDPGCYFYVVDSHSLVQVKAATAASIDLIVEQLCVSTDGDLPDAVLVIVANFARLAVKYGAFGYRLAHFDSGYVAEHLRSAAHSLALQSQETKMWPSIVLEQTLNLVEPDTPIMGAIGISAGTSRTIRSFHHLSVRTQAATDRAEDKSSEHFENADALAHYLHQSSRVQMLSSRVEVPSPRESIYREVMTFHKPVRRNSRSDIWSDLLTRTSSRRFDSRLIQSDVLTAILRANEVPEERGSRAGLVKIIATLKIGFDAQPLWQTYELDRAGQLKPYCDTGTHLGSLAELFVNEATAEAPLVFWLCGDVRRTASWYRMMLFTVGQEAYSLATEASLHGLKGYLVGGIWSERVASTIGVKFCEETPLLAFACGFPQLGQHGH